MEASTAEELYQAAIVRGLISAELQRSLRLKQARLRERGVRIDLLHLALKEGHLSTSVLAGLVAATPTAASLYPTASPVGEPGSLAGRQLEGRIDGYPDRDGGAGAVFLAHEADGARRCVKVYAPLFGGTEPGAGGPALVTGFLAAVRRIAAVEEPSGALVPTFAAGTSSGFPFAVTEHIVGRDLETELLRRPGRQVAAGEVTAIAIRCLRVLRALERAGIRHRAIRPSTILIDEEDRPRLLPPCFLLAGAACAAEAGGDPPLAARRLAGRRVPDYLSPEEARGEVELSAASDLYGLGLVLFRAASGRLPFPGGKHADLEDLARARRAAKDSDDPDATVAEGNEPRRRDPGSSRRLRCAVANLRHRLNLDVPPLRSIVPDVPVLLDLVVWKMTRREPTERYASAAEALADLERASGSKRAIGRGVIPQAVEESDTTILEMPPEPPSPESDTTS